MGTNKSLKNLLNASWVVMSMISPTETTKMQKPA